MKNDSTPLAGQVAEECFTAGPYTLTQTALRYRTKVDDPGDRGQWVSDSFHLHAQVYVEWNPPFATTTGWAVLIEFAEPDGRRQRRLVFYGDLHVHGDQVIAGLTRAGMRIDVERKGRTRFLNYLMRVRPAPLLRFGILTVQGVEGVPCLRSYGLAPEGSTYEPDSFEKYDLYNGGQRLGGVIRILDEEDVI